MQITQTHSHFGGLEFLMVRRPREWSQIKDSIAKVEVQQRRDVGAESRRAGPREPIDTNVVSAEFAHLFSDYGWVPDSDRRDSGFIRDRVGVSICVDRQTLAPSELYARHLAFYVGDQIDVGVEILPMKSLQQQMSSGVAYYEGEFYNVVRQGRGVPAVPLVLIGIEA